MSNGHDRALFYMQFRESDGRVREILDLARALSREGWDIFAVGTCAVETFQNYGLAFEQLDAQPVLTQDGISLSQEIHAGLGQAVVRMRGPVDNRVTVPFDLLCVALSPIEYAIAVDGGGAVRIRQQWGDAAGVSLLASAALGGRVIVACLSEDYVGLTQWIRAGMNNREAVRELLAAKALGVAAEHLLTAGTYEAGTMCRGTVTLGQLRWGSNTK